MLFLEICFENSDTNRIWVFSLNFPPERRTVFASQHESGVEFDCVLPVRGDLHRAAAGPSGGLAPAMAAVLQVALPGHVEPASTDLFLPAAVRASSVPAGGNPGDAQILAQW